MNDELKITTESTDAYYGQVNMLKRAMIGDKLVGYLQYSIYEDQPNVQMIEVANDYKRQGIATALMRSLQADFPGVSINLGMTTDDGTKLFSKIAKKEKNDAYFQLKSYYDKVVKEIEEIDDFWKKCWNPDENGEPLIYSMSETELDKLQDHQDSLEDRKRNLERHLERMSPYNTFIK